VPDSPGLEQPLDIGRAQCETRAARDGNEFGLKHHAYNAADEGVCDPPQEQSAPSLLGVHIFSKVSAQVHVLYKTILC